LKSYPEWFWCLCWRWLCMWKTNYWTLCSRSYLNFTLSAKTNR